MNHFGSRPPDLKAGLLRVKDRKVGTYRYFDESAEKNEGGTLVADLLPFFGSLSLDLRFSFRPAHPGGASY
jgi:hypothetical protein